MTRMFTTPHLALRQDTLRTQILDTLNLVHTKPRWVLPPVLQALLLLRIRMITVIVRVKTIMQRMAMRMLTVLHIRRIKLRMDILLHILICPLR